MLISASDPDKAGQSHIISSETMNVTLLSDTYLPNIRSADQAETIYDLMRSANNVTSQQFITQDNIVSDPAQSVADPEYDLIGQRVAWVTADQELFVAPFDLTTGSIHHDQATLVDTGIARLGLTFNGPEWGYSQLGTQVFYSKMINGELFLAVAQQASGQWTIEILPNSQGSSGIIATKNLNDPAPLLSYYVGDSQSPRQALGWRTYGEDTTKIIPGSEGNPFAARWVEGEPSIVYTIPVDEIEQVHKLNVLTDTEPTQLTTTVEPKVGTSFMWSAPEYPGELLLFALEHPDSDSSATQQTPTQIGVYRQMNGVWERIKIVDPPSSLPFIKAPEPFVFNGKSYLTFFVESVPRGVAEIWIAGVEPDVDWYRQVSDPSLDIALKAPEPVITEAGAFIYYAERRQNIIRRADTGLGLPDPGNNINAALNLGVLEASSTPKNFSEILSEADLNDFLRFQLFNPLTLDLTVENISSDVNIRLLDSLGTELALSNRANNQTINILQELDPGIYHIQVYSNQTPNFDIPYNLTITTMTTDSVGNNLRDALDVGVLDNNPFSQNFSDSVGASDRNDVYRFELSTESEVTLTLDQLSANATVLLVDENNNSIASSRNPGNGSEAINTSLLPGTYFVRVRSADQIETTYDLTLSAQFVVDDQVVSDDIRIVDPEFDPVGSLVTWTDQGNLWVAPVDPQTGDFILEDAQLIDNGLAAPTGGIGRSEWAYSTNGSQIVYTKDINGEYFLGRAQLVNGSWEAGLLLDENDNPIPGFGPYGALDPGADSPRISYANGTGRRSYSWLELDNPANKGALPGAGIRWVVGESESLVLSLITDDGSKQLFKYNTDTDTLTQLTFDPETNTRGAASFMWQAPEFGDQLVLMATVTSPGPNNSADVSESGIITHGTGQDVTDMEVALYREINGEWVQFNIITSPLPDLPFVQSPEPFVVGDKSYISLIFAKEDTDGSVLIDGSEEVWIVGIDPEEPFFRKISTEASFHNDPEYLVTDENAFVYYTSEQGVIRRAVTGLFPIDDTPIDGAGNTFQDALDIGVLNDSSIPQIFSDLVGASDRNDFYRFELSTESDFTLTLDQLSANVTVALVDDSNNVLATSGNPGINPEAITMTLMPGTYFTRVRSADQIDTTYNLTLSAQAIATAQNGSTHISSIVPDQELSRLSSTPTSAFPISMANNFSALGTGHMDVIVSELTTSLPDPEFDQVGNQVTWQDRDGNLWVAQVDPLTGEFGTLDPQTGNFVSGLERIYAQGPIDTNLAPQDISQGGTGNGPEWIYTQGASELIYTKEDEDGNWVIGHAYWTGTEWQAAPLTDADDNLVPGWLPSGTLNAGESKPLIKYLRSTDTGAVEQVWRELNNPTVGGILPGGGGRWVQADGERAIIRGLDDPETGRNEWYKYDVETEELIQLTDDTLWKQGGAFMWHAPELNELVLLSSERSVDENGTLALLPDQLGIYREIGGIWTRVHTLTSPSEELPYIHSPEPFVASDGKSYISLSAVTVNSSGKKSFRGSEVWVMGIDSAENFAQQVNPDLGTARLNDPESFVTEDGTFIYYTEIAAGGLRMTHRAHLDFRSTTDTVGNMRRSALEIGLPDAFPSAQIFTETVGVDDSKDYYEFDLLVPSLVEIDLDGLSANADIFLQDRNGVRIERSTQQGTNPENISTLLDPGRYYAFVRSLEEDANTDYELTIDAEPAIDVELGALTDIRSRSEGIISFRQQEHMWLTNDGAIHTVVKIQVDGNTQQVLMSSFDGGETWQESLQLPDTGSRSTVDGLLLDHELFLAYSTDEQGIDQAKLQYDPIQQQWALVNHNTIYQLAGLTASIPTITVDSQGNIWSAFVKQDTTSQAYTLELFYSLNEGQTWQPLSSPITQPSSTERLSAKLITLDDGIGIIYAQEDTLRWAYRLDDWADNAPWTGQTILEYNEPLPRDSRGSHFSVVVDLLGNIHVVSNDEESLIYTTFDQAQQRWEEPKVLTESGAATYMQISLSTDGRLFVIYDVSGYIEVLESQNGGNTFELNNSLLYSPVDGFDRLGNARMETPTYIQDSLPILRQVSNPEDTIQALVHYNVDIGTTDQGGNSLRSASSLGSLDHGLAIPTLIDLVGADDPRDYYQFELLNPSSVSISIDHLDADANLFLADITGTVLESATNTGTTPDAITDTLLDAGIYHVLVRANAQENNPTTFYELTISADPFVVNETMVSAPTGNLPDPEFDPFSSQVIWQDKQENLWVADVDPLTGDFDLSGATLIDTGLAPISSFNQRTGTGNGPEPVIGLDGLTIVYTKAFDATQDTWEVYQAQFTGNGWATGPLIDADLLPGNGNGLNPIGTLDPLEGNPRIEYVLPSASDEQPTWAWRDLNDANGGIFSDQAQGGARWVNGETEQIVYVEAADDPNTPTVEAINQVFLYDIATDTSTQLTFDSTYKDKPFVWWAPEYGANLLLVGESGSSEQNTATQLGIYQDIGGTWTKINDIIVPTNKAYLRSAEPFVFNGQSYISVLAEDGKKQPSEVWIAGATPEAEFYRQVSDPTISMVRNDPEPVVTEGGVFIYYTERGSSIAYRADTGLGLPEALTLVGTPGDDRFLGDAGGDIISGGGGDDILRGAAGADVIEGGAGNDQLIGDVGDDMLTGAGGGDLGLNTEDSLTGGKGADIFVLGTAADIFYNGNGDDDFARILDFQLDEDFLQVKGSMGDYTATNRAGGAVLLLTSTNEEIAFLENIQAGSLTDDRLLFV